MRAWASFKSVIKKALAFLRDECPLKEDLMICLVMFAMTALALALVGISLGIYHLLAT